MSDDCGCLDKLNIWVCKQCGYREKREAGEWNRHCPNCWTSRLQKALPNDRFILEYLKREIMQEDGI